MAGIRWNIEDINFVKDNMYKIKTIDIAKMLKRTVRGIIHLCEKYQIERPMPKVGEKHHRLTILEIYYKQIKTQKISYAKCMCKCGNETHQKLTDIKSGRIKSCGCYKKDKASETCIKRNYKHGKGNLNNRLYRIWCAMKSRCRNKSNIGYKNYGGRGIIVCDEWIADFEVFEKWSLENGYSNKLTIDRIDNNGNYNSENCRWVDYIVQANNTSIHNSTITTITAFGETKHMQEWLKDNRCKIQHISTLYYRIITGWEPEEAISRPSQRNRVKNLNP